MSFFYHFVMCASCCDLTEVIEEAHLSPDWIVNGIERFAKDKDARLKRLGEELAALD